MSCMASVIFRHLKSIERQKDAVIWIIVLRTGLLRMLPLSTEFCKFRLIFVYNNTCIADYSFVFLFLCYLYTMSRTVACSRRVNTYQKQLRLILCSSAYVHVTGQRVYIPYDIMFVSACDNTKAMYRPCFYNWDVNIDPSVDKAWSQQVETPCSWTQHVEKLANEFRRDQHVAVKTCYTVFQLETVCCK